MKANAFHRVEAAYGEHEKLSTPVHHGRHRTQPAAGSTEAFPKAILDVDKM